MAPAMTSAALQPTRWTSSNGESSVLFAISTGMDGVGPPK